jgi:hypothetical protein
MTNYNNIIALLAALLVLGGTYASITIRRDASALLDDNNILYVGLVNASQDAVAAVNIATNQTVNFSFASYPNRTGPRGLFFKGNTLTVAFQNVGQPNPGDIIQFDKNTGSVHGILVPQTDPEAAFIPRGIIWIPGNHLVVADIGSQVLPTSPGHVRIYNYHTGGFIRKLSAPSEKIAIFHPRGVVYLDGKLFVTSFVATNLSEGYISRFDPITGFEEVIANHTTCLNLHRPEGIVLGPDGNLWVASFRNNATDVDRILVFTLQGECIQEIPLYEIGEPRAFAQALVFGPDDELYIGITGLFPLKGVWKYNTETGQFGVVVSDFEAWYLAFKKTDPATLEYA